MTMLPDSLWLKFPVHQFRNRHHRYLHTVVLDAQPTNNVVLAITSSDAGEATVNSPLTFTNANWNTPQTVTVTGVDDNIIDGNINSTITISVVDAVSTTTSILSLTRQ